MLHGQTFEVGKMPDCRQVEILIAKLGVGEPGRKLIDSIRKGAPVRRVGGGRSNVCVRYPSRKMGCVIQAESHTVELALIYEMEHDPEVFEYYDQPASLKLKYQSLKNKNLGVLHTPDFLVIRTDSIRFVECKTEEELLNLAIKSPGRYQKNSDGVWVCPPGEEAASEYGLGYRVWSSSEVDWTFYDNIRFLEDYFDDKCADPDPEDEDRIRSVIRKKKAVSVLELIRDFDVNADIIYRLIATDRLEVDIRKVRLRELEQVMLFSDPIAEEAYRSLVLSDSENGSLPHQPSPGHLLRHGAMVLWDGTMFTAINVGEKKISLQTEDGEISSIFRIAFEDLLERGNLKFIDDSMNSSSGPERNRRLELLEKTKESDLEKALERRRQIQEPDHGKEIDHVVDSAPGRTLRRWREKFRKSQLEFGDGVLGLVPGTANRGNRTRKLPETVLNLMDKTIDEVYETTRQISVQRAYRHLCSECKEQGVIVPSYKTFRKAVRMRPKEEQTRKRKGNRAAYASEKLYWSLDLTTPRHGARPFDISHIDHTEMDIELVDSVTGKTMGRPWLTLMIDAYSRMVVGFYLTFDAPSYRSCMMVLRDCVRRFKRFPQTLVLDNGKEFQSVAFEGLLAAYECEKKSRPPAKARFGSVCERFFGKTNTELLYGLAGNTQITKNVRQVTKSVNPKNLAVWTLPEMYRLIEGYLFEIYPSLDHPALDDSPKAAFDRGMIVGGERSHRIVLYTEEFRIRTLPSPPKGTGKINPNTGIQLQYIHYWHDSFRNPEVSGRSVPVKYDPEDASVIYAFVEGRWVQCLSENSGTFQGKSRKEILIASRELSGTKKSSSRNRTITAGKLANFLDNALDAEETLRQRKKDSELKKALEEGALSPVDKTFREVPRHRPAPAEQENGLADIVELVRKRKERTAKPMEDF